MNEKVVRGQFMKEGAKGRPMDCDIGGSRFPINIVNKLIGLNRNDEVKEVNTATYFLNELYGWIRAIRESNNLWYEFFWSLLNIENIIDVARQRAMWVRRGWPD